MVTSDNRTGSGASAKRTKLIIIGVSALLVVVVLAITAAIIIHRNSISTAAAPESPPQVSTSSKAVKALCEGTQYKDTCANSLSSVGNLTDPNELIRVALEVTVKEVERAMEKSKTLEEVAKDPMGKQAVENCKGLMGSAIEDLKKSFTQMGEFDMGKTEEYSENLQIWLTAATTFQRTCLDGFENTTGDAGEKMKSLLKTSMELTTNGLAMVHNLATVISSLQIGLLNRRLLSSSSSSSFRRLLQAPPSTPNVVVAQDGSGKYKTVGEALKDIPLKGATPFVIYIKEGVYKEYITITPSMTNVVMVGDGPTKTKITGNKNFKDGVNTFNTATFAVEGNYFTAKNIGFENTAGAEKHQAVAVRAQGDFIIFHNCQFDGYQDTLYAHAHRQFYRDCTITGTVDFIFGDATVVFQNSKIIVRKPLPNQQCLVTASGRSSNIEASGIVIQNSVITGEPGLDTSVTKTYMGRPWRAYARTVVMESQLDALIHPDGWLPWEGDFGLNTLFYAEYGNRGPGSATANRVKWAGIKTLSSQDVLQFTPGRFVVTDDWIKNSGVPYTSGMVNH